MAYAQLTREQRYQIYILRKAGHPKNFIATEIGVHPSTITRELMSGSGQRGYRPKQANELATARKQKRYRAHQCDYLDFDRIPRAPAVEPRTGYGLAR